jgi:transcription elongation factor Elf1
MTDVVEMEPRKEELMTEEFESCFSCGSLRLVTQAVHTETGWTHEIRCMVCRYVVESVSYLSQELDVNSDLDAIGQPRSLGRAMGRLGRRLKG